MSNIFILSIFICFTYMVCITNFFSYEKRLKRVIHNFFQWWYHYHLGIEPKNTLTTSRTHENKNVCTSVASNHLRNRYGRCYALVVALVVILREREYYEFPRSFHNVCHTFSIKIENVILKVMAHIITSLCWLLSLGCI